MMTEINDRLFAHFPVDLGLSVLIYVRGKSPISRHAINKLISLLEITKDCFVEMEPDDVAIWD